MRRSQQYPEPQKQPFDQGIQKSTIIGHPSTPIPQHPPQVSSHHFFQSQRQMTPLSNEGFRIHHQGKENTNSAQNIIISGDNPPIMQRQVPQGQQFFHNIPQTARNQPGQIKIVQQNLPGNFQVIQAPKIDRVIDST